MDRDWGASGTPRYIIAEAGVNHNGDVDLAHDLVDVAANAGADAIKFQTFNTSDLVTSDAKTAEYQQRSGEVEQDEMLEGLELEPSDVRELADYCRRKGVAFLSTPYDQQSVSLLDSLDIDMIKVASADIINKPLLKHIAETGRPIILSSGMATMEEIAQALSWIRETENNDVVLLHCVSEYPADPSDLNLQFIETLDAVFNNPIGFSDHSKGIIPPVVAVALGARVIEKHFTLDSSMEGPDHAASLEPHELEEMISAIRLCEQSLGNEMKKITQGERENAKRMRTSLHAAADLQVGDRLTSDNISITRPADGLAPRHFNTLQGSRVKCDMKSGEPITWEDIG